MGEVPLYCEPSAREDCRGQPEASFRSFRFFELQTQADTGTYPAGGLCFFSSIKPKVRKDQPLQKELSSNRLIIGTGKLITEAERKAYHENVSVHFNKKAWADDGFAIHPRFCFLSTHTFVGPPTLLF